MELPLLFHAAAGTGVDPDQKTRSLLQAGADPLVQDADDHTPLVYVVSKLCADALDYEAAFRNFYDGLDALSIPSESTPANREAFIAEIAPRLQIYVSDFAAKIPIPTGCEYESKWRQERIACIELLCAYEAWAQSRSG